MMRICSTSVPAVIAAFSLVGLSPPVGASASGELDPTFHTSTDLPALPSGDVVVPGSGGTVFVGGQRSIVKLGFGGAIDRHFGRHGVVQVPGELPEPRLAAGGRGRLLLAGRIVLTGVLQQGAAVYRLSSRGVLDSGFGGSGRYARLGPGLEAIARAPDGSIVIAGPEDPVSGSGRLVIRRLTPSGHLDRRFGSDGLVALDAGQRPDVRDVAFAGSSVVVLASVFARRTLYRAVVVKLGPDGSPAPGFGRTGARAVGTLIPMDLAVQRDGRMLVSFVQYPNGEVIRLLRNGKRDRSFGTGGLVTGRPVGAMVQQRDGRIVAIDRSFRDGAPGLVRLRRDGRLDRSFSGAMPRDPRGRQVVVLHSLMQTRDGRVTVAGANGYDDRLDFDLHPVVARYLAGSASLQVIEARIDGGDLRVQVRCETSGGDHCRTALRLSFQQGAKRVAAGGRSLRAPRGRVRTTRVALSSAARAVLRSTGELSVRAETTTSDRIGYVDVRRSTVVLGRH
jgi:uncharacterized delta-60 repeat protein